MERKPASTTTATAPVAADTKHEFFRRLLAPYFRDPSVTAGTHRETHSPEDPVAAANSLLRAQTIVFLIPIH